MSPKRRGCTVKIEGGSLKIKGCILKRKGRTVKMIGCTLKIKHTNLTLHLFMEKNIDHAEAQPLRTFLPGPLIFLDWSLPY